MFREYHAEYALKAMNEELSYEQYLFELAQIECEVRRANKIIRLVKASKLPMEKTLENFRRYKSEREESEDHGRHPDQDLEERLDDLAGAG